MSATPEPEPSEDGAQGPSRSRETSDELGPAEGHDGGEDAGKLTADGSSNVLSNGDWQAIYDSQSGHYYFRNTKTNETTWTNPFDSPSGASSSREAAAIAQGIDPELAHLDPSLSRGANGSGGSYSFSARFDARTGKFQGDPTFDPSRVSEYARGRKQAGAYFDVEGWEKSLESSGGRIAGTSREVRAREIAEGKKLTKAEIARFKERKAEKKAKRQRAWLLE